MKTKILHIFVFLSGCCFIGLLHFCFPHVWLFVTSCTFTFLSCRCCFDFPLFCCVIIVFDFIFKCFVHVFHCLLFIFMWFFFIWYRIFLTALPGSFFRVRWINSYQNKKKCMNCLEIYWGLHELMFAYSHLSAYKCFVYVFHCLLFIFMWFFFIWYRIFLTALPGSFFRVWWINSYQNKKKCINCLEIYCTNVCLQPLTSLSTTWLFETLWGICWPPALPGGCSTSKDMPSSACQGALRLLVMSIWGPECTSRSQVSSGFSPQVCV